MPVASACAPAKPYRQGDAHADPAPGSPAPARSKLYNPRHPERTVLYRAVAGHLQTWLALFSAGQVDGQGDQQPPVTYVEQAFRKYLECGILAHGFARVWCEDCAHDYLVAFSCKGRAVCPSCNARRMEQTAAHLVDHVFPHLPVRQWVLSVPKRLRYFMQRDGAALNSALRIFLRVIEQCLLRQCPGVAKLDKASVHIGAVAFIHRFGSSLNTHVHFHICAIDGVFEALWGDITADPATPPGVAFHPASGIDPAAVAQVQAQVRTRILRAFAGRGLIERFEAREMLAFKHSGFSVNAGVRIQAQDRAGLERLLRYCARPPFALERLRQRGAELVYHCPKPQSGGKQADLVLSPLALIERIAALVPPPRTHRHRYYGVLAPNAPLRAVVTAMAQSGPAQVAVGGQSGTREGGTGEGASGSVLPGNALGGGVVAKIVQAPAPEPPRRFPAHYLWAVLIARIYEVFPLVCPLCGGNMRILAFVTEGVQIRRILEHIGVDAQAPPIAPARGPPLWDECDAQGADGAGQGAPIDPDWGESAQTAPDDAPDQRTEW